LGKPKNEYCILLINTTSTMNQETIVIEKDETDDKKKKKDKDKKKGGIVLTKKRNVETDKLAIISYNDKESRLVMELSNHHDQLVQAIDSIGSGTSRPTTEGTTKKGGLEGALGLCIQEFAKALKFIGNIMLRVFILTDDMHRQGISSDEKKYTEISRDIGVYVDILYFGSDPENKGVDSEADADGFFVDEAADEAGHLRFDSGAGSEPLSVDDRSVLEGQGLLIPGLKPMHKPGTSGAPVPAKRKKMHKDIRMIVELTDGMFYNGQQNTVIINKWARKLGDIKDLEEGLEVFESPPVRKKKLLAAIAEELLPLDVGEIQAISQGKSQTKCNICFKKDNPTTFRLCSYCKREMHLSCVMKWAEQDQEKEESFIFRCPFCFHLLKVDPSITKLMDLQTMRANVAKLQESKTAGKPRDAIAVCLEPSQILSIIEPCNVCGSLLEEEDCVYQCSNCKAAYHNKCFGSTQEKPGEFYCRKCGFKFTHVDPPNR
jgi:hypothetical protein